MPRSVCQEPSTSTSTFNDPSQRTLQKNPHSRLKQCTKKNHKHLERSQSRPRLSRTVYVGNLVPGICKGRLANLFGRFGRVAEITVRCSGGLVVGRTDVPNARITAKDGFYATLRFKDPDSVGGALSLNGSSFEKISIPDKRLVVSLSASDLPEAQKKL